MATLKFRNWSSRSIYRSSITAFSLGLVCCCAGVCIGSFQMVDQVIFTDIRRLLGKTNVRRVVSLNRPLKTFDKIRVGLHLLLIVIDLFRAQIQGIQFIEFKENLSGEQYTFNIASKPISMLAGFVLDLTHSVLCCFLSFFFNTVDFIESTTRKVGN